MGKEVCAFLLCPAYYGKYYEAEVGLSTVYLSVIYILKPSFFILLDAIYVAFAPD